MTDQISHLGKTLSTAASVLIGSQDIEKNVENNLLSNSPRNPYRKTLQESLTAADFMNHETFDKLRKTRAIASTLSEDSKGLYSQKSREKYFTNKVSDKKTTFKVLSHLSDDLLKDLPETAQSKSNTRDQGETKLLKESDSTDASQERIFSLYQGFEASIPVINRSVEKEHLLLEQNNQESAAQILPQMGNKPRIRSGPWEDLLESKEDTYISLDFNPERISNIKSKKELERINELANNNLVMLDIRKKLSADEIDEIKKQIQDLQLKQNLLVKKIAAIEENELFLEDIIRLIGHRSADFSNDTQIEFDQAKSLSGLNNPESMIDATRPTALERKNSIDIVETSLNEIRTSFDGSKQSIEGKDNHNALNGFFEDASNKKSRKAQPTVQKYYNSGKKLSTIPKAHDDAITCLDFDPHFSTLCTAGYMDHIVKLWDYTKKRQIGAMEGHVATISCMQVDKNYNMVATGSKDATVKLWNANDVIGRYEEGNNSEALHTLDAHLDEVSSLYIDGANLMTASQDKTIRRWDLYSGKCIQVFDVNFPSLSAYKSSFMKSNEDSMILKTVNTPIIGSIQSFDAALATGTKDGLIRLWDMRTGEVVRFLEGHMDAITSLKFDATTIISGSLDGTMRLWDLRSNNLTDIISYEKPISSLDFDAKHIVVASNEHNTHIYDRNDGNKWDLQDEEQDTTSLFVKYKERYTMEGRSNGDIGIWIV